MLKVEPVKSASPSVAVFSSTPAAEMIVSLLSVARTSSTITSPLVVVESDTSPLAITEVAVKLAPALLIEMLPPVVEADVTANVWLPVWV